jgi:DNA-binding transcriptional MerR regulator
MNPSPPETAYTLEMLAEVSGVATQTIVEYQECGLIHAGYNDETVRLLRRMEHLREACGMNLRGLKLMTGLLEELEQLRAELRARR